MESHIRAFVWAPARVLWDDPASINDPGLRTMSKAACPAASATVEREVLVETAYFVPQAGGVALAERAALEGRPDAAS